MTCLNELSVTDGETDPNDRKALLLKNGFVINLNLLFLTKTFLGK